MVNNLNLKKNKAFHNILHIILVIKNYYATKKKNEKETNFNLRLFFM